MLCNNDYLRHKQRMLFLTTYCSFFMILSLFFAYCPLTYAKNNNATAKQSASVANNKKQKSLSSEQQFYSMVTSFYNSDNPLLRSVAFVKTKSIPFTPSLDKALRLRLTKTQHNAEKYLILNTLASITHKRKDFDAFVKFILAHPYVILQGSEIDHIIQDGKLSTTDIYPWMAHHNVYKRQAFLFGLITALSHAMSWTEEAGIGYISRFPTYAQFPEYDYYWLCKEREELMSYGLSSHEVTWLEKAQNIQQEEKTYWDDLIFNDTRWERRKISAEWDSIFDTFLPLLDMGGKGAELAKKFVSSQFQHHWNKDVYTEFQ